MIRALPLAILALAAFAPPALRAEEPRRAIVALDRGAGAEEHAARLGDRAIRLVAALQRRGVDALLLAVGADAGGKPSVSAPQPTLAGVAALAKKEAFAHAGPTDPRSVLDTILQADAGEKPIDVYLLGPFSALPAGRARAAAPVAGWNATAPDGSRILPLGVCEAARALLAGARGLQAGGWVVLSFQKPGAETEPYSALQDPEARAVPLRARVQLAPEVLPVAGAGSVPALVTATTDLESDTVSAQVIEGLHLFTVARTLRDGRAVTVSFRGLEPEGVLWLCDPPGPLTFEWDRLRPGARVTDVAGRAAPAFEAVDVQAGNPVSAAFRILRSRVGAAPAWRGPAELPTGLTWTVGPEVRISPEVGESELRIEFRARPATPLDAAGELVLRAEGIPDPLTVPYTLRVRPGRATLALNDARTVIPPARNDPPILFTIEADANTPRAVPLHIDCETDHGEWLFGQVTAADGTTRQLGIGQALDIPVNTELQLRFGVRGDADTALRWPCVVTATLQRRPGIETSGRALIEIRGRSPRLFVDEKGPALRVEDGAVVVDRPLVLRLDPDGGDRGWLLGLMQIPPRVARSEGGVGAWSIEAREPGTWHVSPAGAWSGGDARIFDDGRAVERIWIEWDGGDAPAPIDVPVAIPARWGTKGWLFVGLALLAVALGLGALFLMRPPPMTGTLLYTVARLPGTVGRLDLAPAGRKPAVVAADKRGRLELGIAGEMVARLKPTRVGGVIEVRDAEGGWERRLLVDGLALRAGTHTLRYVSGQVGAEEAQAAMEAVPDLLGPEYDIESGRIESLDS